MTTFSDYLDKVLHTVPLEAGSAGLDASSVIDGLVSEFLVGEQNAQIGLSERDAARVSASYHSSAKAGIMRTAGISSDEYDRVLASDPVRMACLRHEYLATI